ncbi:MAG: hypothetical protein ACNA7W_04250 [Pseudomonadales bacterium]
MPLFAAAALLLAPALSLGYEPQVHQRLTFFAAKALNRCLEGTEVPPLTPLQVRFIATSNMGLANSNALVRFFRWGYFDAADGGSRKFLWLVNTRFSEHFEQLEGKLQADRDESSQYRKLGRVVSYVQLVSSPPRALPVYSVRFWRWNFSDRFDRYPLDEAALQQALAGDCGFLDAPPDSYRGILEAVAADTLDAVRAPMDGLPSTWEPFWTPADAGGDFGSYGPAGNNFGRRAKFPCSEDPDQRCVLVADDPLYADFALQRQLAAVRGTAQAMYLFQRRASGDSVNATGARHVE